MPKEELILFQLGLVQGKKSSRGGKRNCTDENRVKVLKELPGEKKIPGEVICKYSLNRLQDSQACRSSVAVHLHVRTTFLGRYEKS